MDIKAQAEDAPVAADMGTNQSGMRARNERLVLSLLRRHGPMAKSELARMTGLSAQTVSVIMRQLERDGLLVRGEPIRGRVGQPSVPMALSPDGALFYGLKIGRRSTDLVLTDFLGQVLARDSMTYAHPTPLATLDFAERAYAKMQSELTKKQKSRISGLGIAMPFQLWDWATALKVDPAEMADWREHNLQDRLQTALSLPVYVKNDASAACGAELVFGREQVIADFIYFYIGYFIGGGIVLNRQLFVGRSGNAGALGSIPVPDSQGRMVQLLDVASLSGLEHRLAAEGRDYAHMWQAPEDWRLDEAIVDQWLEQAAHGIAHALTSAVSVVDFSAAVIEGWLPAPVKAKLVDKVRHALGQMNLSGVTCPDVLEGTVGPDARALGAASLPLSERYLLEASL